MQFSNTESFEKYLRTHTELTHLTVDAHYLSTIPQIPESLESLAIYNCKSQLELPNGLKLLRISNWKGMQNLPPLPKSLESLTIENTWAFCHRFPELPNELKELRLENTACPKLTRLPDGLKVMSILGRSCTEVELPEGLEELRIVDSTVREIKGDFPCSLHKLELSDLVRIPALPKNLSVLRLRNMKLTFNSLPTSLREVELDSCHGCIEEIPSLLYKFIVKGQGVAIKTISPLIESIVEVDSRVKTIKLGGMSIEQLRAKAI